jgi:hypothetical protein
LFRDCGIERSCGSRNQRLFCDGGEHCRCGAVERCGDCCCGWQWTLNCRQGHWLDCSDCGCLRSCRRYRDCGNGLDDGDRNSSRDEKLQIFVFCGWRTAYNARAEVDLGCRDFVHLWKVLHGDWRPKICQRKHRV